MNLQVLVSTMHQSDYSLISKMNLQSNAIIVNQSDQSAELKMPSFDKHILWVESKERGLSKSRNTAIQKADGDICLLSDDDLIYINDYEEVILDQFKKNPEADVIVFQVHGIESNFKNYHQYSRKIGFINSMKVASVEIAFRLESIKKQNIYFDESFGAGAEFYMGEENIFLFECLKNNLNILYIPIKIADLHVGNSTWFKGYNRQYLFNKGAAFTRMTKLFSIILILQFAIRKYRLYSSECNIFQSIKYMLQGRKKYILNSLNK